MLWMSFCMPNWSTHRDDLLTSQSRAVHLVRRTTRMLLQDFVASARSSTSAICTASGATSAYRHTVILDHRVRQKPVAHGLEVGLGLGLVGLGKLDVEHLALAHRADAAESQALPSACSIALPCGSSTPFLSVTVMRALVTGRKLRLAAMPERSSAGREAGHAEELSA